MSKERNILVFQTDFGTKETSVSEMYGVVKTVDHSIEIIEGTHQLPPYDTWSASFRLMKALRWWPEGTIYVSVVDPGVGTDRRASVAKMKNGTYVVTPDNGTLTHVDAYIGVEEIREIDKSVNMLNTGTSIFHGRDLFGYCAAKLAAGKISYEEVGPAYPVSEIIKMELKEPYTEDGIVKGIIEIDDTNFGNLFTNIPTDLLLQNGMEYGHPVHMTITHDNEVRYEDNAVFDVSFGMVKKGDVIIYNNEMRRVALAITQGDFMNTFGIGFGNDWEISFEKVEG